MAAPICENTSNNEIDNFKHVYKFYKRRDRPLDIKEVIDFTQEDVLSHKEVEAYHLHNPDGKSKFPGMKPVKDWKAFQLKNYKGFIVIRNPFEDRYQRYWIQRCLVDFPKKPNRTNLDAHMNRPSQVWHTCLHNNRPDLKKDSLLMKLRWATLGYQYEWNTKEYFADRVLSFPNDLSYMCSYIAAALGYPDFSSEAGIVNFYRLESTLMGHTDVSELDKAAPLISFSFAQSCIFLIGGPTKETKPLPVFLHSGDICLMLGPARLSYHAVPRIVPANQDYLHRCFYGDSQTNMNGHCTEQSTILVSDSTSHTHVSDSDGVHVPTNTNEIQNINNQAKESSSTAEMTECEEDEDPYSDHGKNKLEREKIMKQPQTEVKNETIVPTVTEAGHHTSEAGLQSLMDQVLRTVDWEPFQQYCHTSRVNVNVRQVMKAGLSLPLCPQTIVPCQGKS